MHWSFFLLFFNLAILALFVGQAQNWPQKSKISDINAALHIRHVEVSSWCSIIHDLNSYVFQEQQCSVDNISEIMKQKEKTTKKQRNKKPKQNKKKTREASLMYVPLLVHA